ncbi:MAG: type II toxin-antitoxin system RelE/ParE family toxin [Clostridiales bacterium]|jgi:mRNA interferase RelE/StbE|nr:type II toxin-antitoxin system RelE/ParE family toxin [Clostridiales bacterium]
MEPNYSKQADKFLKSQDAKTYARIKKAVAALPKGDICKMQGYKDLYRLKVGDFRILFKRIAREIFVTKIDNRGQVYR